MSMSLPSWPAVTYDQGQESLSHLKTTAKHMTWPVKSACVYPLGNSSHSHAVNQLEVVVIQCIKYTYGVVLLSLCLAWLCL